MISFRRQQKNLFKEIEVAGADDDFEPTKTPTPTEALAGSKEKIEILRKRLEDGEEMWHDDDPAMSDTIENQTIASVFCLGQRDMMLAEKREAALEQAKNRNARQQAKNKWNQSYRRRTSKNPTPARYAKHPDVLES